MKKIAMIFVLVLLLIALPVVTKAQDGAVPQVISGEMIPCSMPLAPGDVDGENVICGQIEVPSDWDDLGSDPITITYARKLSHSLSPLEDPIIFFHGGPGGSVLASQGSSHFDFNYLRETRDVIIFDQRGNRYSSDLLCPQDVLDRDTAASAELVAEAPQFTLEGDQQEIREYVDTLYFEAEGQSNCPAYFEGEGIDVGEYSTENTVQDAIALMGHLDYPVYNLFGISYGTTVATAIMEYYQTHPGADLPLIRSAAIDGIAPLDMVSAADAALTAPRNMLRIFSDCEADEACSAAYPGIQQTFVDLLATLEAEPITDADGGQVTLQDLIAVTGAAASTRVDLVPYLPRMMDELSRGETAVYQVVQTLLSSEPQPAMAAPAAATTNPIDVLTARAETLAEQLRALANDVGDLGETSEDLASAFEEAETLPELYVALLNRYLDDSDPSVRDQIANVILANFVTNPELQVRPGLAAITGFVAEPVSGELQAVVNLMTDEDITAVFELLTDESELSRLIVSDAITNLVVKCNTPGYVNTIADGYEELGGFEAPQLISSRDLQTFVNLVLACEVFDLVSDEAAAEPVLLDLVPVLILNGGTDHATPVEWGEITTERFGDFRMLTVPRTDHGVTRFSKCAKDIAHTFFLNPEMELTTDCVETFAATYVLPDDPLPGETAQLFDGLQAAGPALYFNSSPAQGYYVPHGLIP
ncbi:MAG: alpha/beta fold hydrolase [Candidatus Promineifilaceae bacterium]|nr:alpha/beta fold hydrolase [Candidatus Promineifilaceae bacterium]